MLRSILTCSLMVVLALSGCAGPQEQFLPPEEILKKIQESIDAPETITAEYRIDGIPISKDAKVLAAGEGTIEIKRGNKVRVVMTLRLQGQQRTTEIVSNGKRMFGMSGNSASVPHATPSSFEGQVRTCLTSLTLVSLAMLGTPEGNKDARELFKVTGVGSGEDDGAQKTLVITFKPGEPNGPIPTAKLWYDPKTFLVSKRVLTTSKNETPIAVTESFPKITLGAAIADDVFEVPE